MIYILVRNKASGVLWHFKKSFSLSPEFFFQLLFKCWTAYLKLGAMAFLSSLLDGIGGCTVTLSYNFHHYFFLWGLGWEWKAWENKLLPSSSLIFLSILKFCYLILAILLANLNGFIWRCCPGGTRLPLPVLLIVFIIGSIDRREYLYSLL